MRNVARRILRYRAALAVLVLAVALGGCAKGAPDAGPYHCPMHPTYVSDKPGDCPICGMRLVPIDKDSKGKEAVPAEGHSHGAAPATPAAPAAPAPAAATIWTCPMDPEVVSDKPGKCPKCGMDLEPKAAPAEGGVSGLAPVDTTAEGRRLAGIQTVPARQERLATTIRTVGSVVVDETRVRHVHTKIAGWVDRLFIDFTGQAVKKGRPLLAIYSQELLASQEEYLRAREAAARFAGSSLPEVRRGGEDLVTAARRRLELLDVPPGLLAAIERTGKPQRAVTLMAPSSGVVTAKQIFEGQQVEPGMELFTVTDLSHVWIEADVYENEAGRVRVGDSAALTLAYDPGRRRTGRVAFIAPTVSPETRTLKVRFEFDNADLALKPGMYANVELDLESADGVVVPDSAVMDTGARQVAFVEVDEGRFQPRRVRTGLRMDGRVQILEGLRAGERVAIRANFLLDSESRLRAALAPADAAAP
jgi:RND family efflux transporter MFP subunit